MLEALVGCVTMCTWLAGIWFYPRCVEGIESCCDQYCFVPTWSRNEVVRVQPNSVIDEAEAYYSNFPTFRCRCNQPHDDTILDDLIRDRPDHEVFCPVLVPASLLSSSPIPATTTPKYTIPVAKLIKID